jgi:nucleotide-binding universal stress UspA family protein
MNSQLALEIAWDQAAFISKLNGGEAKIVALHLVPPGSDEHFIAQRRRDLVESLQLDGSPIELRIIPSADPVNEILAASEGFNEIVVGAPEERLLEQQLFGSVPQKVAEEATINVIMVKRYDRIKHGLLRRLSGGGAQKLGYGQD